MMKAQKNKPRRDAVAQGEPTISNRIIDFFMGRAEQMKKKG